MTMQHTRPLAHSPRTLPARLLAFAALLLALGGAHAQQNPAAAIVPIGGFELAGEMVLGSDETSRILAPFMRAPGTPQTLQQAGAALEAALQPRGYTVRRVSLQPPEADSRGRFAVIRFEIAKRAADVVAPTPEAALPAASGASTRFPIRGYELSGDLPLSSEETSRILAPFIRQDGNLATLQQAGAALEAALQAKGYALHRVTLPPQEVGNKVSLTVVKFVVGKITVEGSGPVSEKNIRASLPELREGEAPNFRTLAVQTAIANENPAKQVQVSLKESEEADKIDVKLRVLAEHPLSLSAGLANTGSDATGNDRLVLVGSHANLFDRDQQLSFAYTSSLERTQNVRQLGLNYRIPLYALGGVVGLSYTSSDVVGSFGSFNSSGAGETYGANYNLYLAPLGGRRSYLSLALDEKHFNVSKINDVPVPGQMERSSRPLTLGYSARQEADRALGSYSADLAVNLPGNSGNTLQAYQTEDGRIQTVDWTALHLGGNYQALLTSGWLWSARLQAQVSENALISGEQFGLGGATSVRGTAERALSGDSGAALSLELSTPELYQGLRLLGFVDAGWLSSNHTQASTAGKLASDQLASAGLGLRYSLGWLNLSADWGHVVTGANTPVNAGSTVPRAGDEKLHINLTARF
jgi:hemolysin activation/secretion protein